MYVTAKGFDPYTLGFQVFVHETASEWGTTEEKVIKTLLTDRPTVVITNLPAGRVEKHEMMQDLVSVILSKEE
jgi:hypothetical protein